MAKKINYEPIQEDKFRIPGPKNFEEEIKRYETICNIIRENPVAISERNKAYLGKIYQRLYTEIKSCDLTPEIRNIRSNLLMFTGVESEILKLYKGATL